MEILYYFYISCLASNMT